MSLELIDRLIESWDDSDYKGLQYNPELFNKITIDETINNKIAKDIEDSRYLKPNMNKITYYDENQLLDYYKDHGFILGDKNGYKIEDDSYKYEPIIGKLIKKNTNNILELGFNSGMLSTLLLMNTNATITSLDRMNQIYTWYGKLFIDYKFPKRHFLINSTIINPVPLRRDAENSKMRYDIIWAKSSYSQIYDSIIALRSYSHDNTIIIMDDINPHTNNGLQQYLIMLKLIRDDILVLDEHIKVDKKYNNGIAILRYKSNNIKFESETPMNEIYKSIEINIPMREFEEYIYTKSNDVGFSNLIVKKYLRKLMNLDIVIDKHLMNYIKENLGINI